ncbi:hypothetical protein [Rubrimonas sp.]|uniref:hypothetical protein n=1 Tax=Rubrimonas sp. TaxID=2036015 RepID=UPI002FDC9CF1
MIRSLVLAALLFPGAALAQDWSEGWSGRVTLYGWLPAAELDSAAPTPGGGRLSSGVSAGLDNVLDALDFAAFANAEARRGRLLLLGDVMYTKLSTDGAGPAGARIDTGLKAFVGTGAVGWRLWSDETASIDAFGGARLVSTEVDLSRSDALESQSASATETFVDPLIGLRVGYQATDRIALRAAADIGGFGLGSDFSWEAFVGGSYAFSERIRGDLGFRYLSIDYENDGVEVDLQLYGPTVGFSVVF